MWANARAAQSLENLEGIRVLTDLSVVGSPTLSFGVASEKFLTEKPQLVRKYLKTVQEIYDFIEANPQRAAEILQKANGTPVEQSLANFQASINYVDVEQRHVEALANLYAWMQEKNIIKFPYDIRNYTNVDALKAAFPGRGEFK
jgi:ABC-type nitrate/sulfonate/bicarbonate transport system substrate-binding protein